MLKIHPAPTRSRGRPLAAVDQFERGVHLALALARGEVITSRVIKERFGVSWATAKRDLVRLQCALPVETNVIATRFLGPRHELRLMR